MKQKFLDLLRECAEAGEQDLFANLKSLILRKFKGTEVTDALREIRLDVAAQADVPVSDEKEIVLRPEDFQKKRIADTNTPVKSTVAASPVGNRFKAMLELNDDQLKNKFLDEKGKPSVALALDFINKIREANKQELLSYKSFSKQFMEQIRATLVVAGTQKD